MTQEDLLDRAASAARHFLGATPPNPPVGALALDAHGRILAEAAHMKTGGPHAEVALLTRLTEMGALSSAKTFVITLEPCNHRGRTPPCTEALLASPVRHLIIGSHDPNPNVTGGGIAYLKEKGFQVEVFPEHLACQALISGFQEKMVSKKPWITIKCARRTDGSMIPPAGQKTFTTRDQLRVAHLLRKKSDAILTGSGTVIADNPLFTVRTIEDYTNKKRILAILDRQKRVSESYKEAAQHRGFEVLIFTNLHETFDYLARAPIHDVLIEAGPTLVQSILEWGHWDMLVTLYEDPPEKIDVSFNVRQSRFDTHSHEILSYFLPHNSLRA